MATLWDRALRRAGPAGYNETYYTGAEYASGIDSTGRGREGGSQGLVRQARRAMRENGVVFACELVKMSLFSEARFKFQSMVDDHLFGDQSLDLLEHPWPNGQAGDLLTRSCQDGGMGNSYFRRATDADSGRTSLVRLPQERVTIISEELTDSEGRTWRQPHGYAEDLGPGRDIQIYTVDEVAHFAPIPDPDKNWIGMSWLSPVLREARADSQLSEYKEWHLTNGAMPGLVIKYSSKLSNPTIEKLRTRLKARYGGAENAGNVLVLDEGADLTVAGSTLEQLQYEAVSKAGERRVCAAAGPGLLEILGFEPGDYQAAIRKLGDLWARPWWRSVCGALEHLVPTSANVGAVRLWYDVSGVAALREGELQRGQAFLVNVQGIASAVAAGYKRESAVAAAAAGDVAQLVPDPGAPAAGVTGRETATERLGPGGTPIPPTGGPAGGPINGRPPQGGRPQQLSQGKPNVPNALPGGFKALPSGRFPARGPQPSRRSEDLEEAVLPADDRSYRDSNVADADAILGYLMRMRDGGPMEDPPESAVRSGWLAADNELAWLIARSDPRWRRLGLGTLDARLIAEELDPARRQALRARWDDRLHPRVAGGPKGGQFTASGGGHPSMPGPAKAGHTVATGMTAGAGHSEVRAAAHAQATAAALGMSEQRFGAPDSLTRYTDASGALTPQRQKLWDRITTDLLAGHTRSARPSATFLGGGTASGKSTIGGGPVGSVAIDADEIKGQLPEYQQMIRRGDPHAAAYSHEESSALSKRVQAAAISAGYDFTLDGTGDNAYEKMKAKIDAAKSKGYAAHGKYVTVDTDTAIERAKARAAKTGRMVPESVIRQIHADVSKVFEKLVANDDFDAVELWDTNGTRPVLIGSKPEGGEWQVKDERAWRRFLSKAA